MMLEIFAMKINLLFILLTEWTQFATLSSQTTLTQTLPNPVTSGYSRNDLSRLWKSVEHLNPVVHANITHVLEPLKNFSVGHEPPPFRPAYLQATTVHLKLPEGFRYGVATAATQVEGAVKSDGRGPTNWDWTCHNYMSWCNNFTTDVTINQYHQYKQDIQRVKAMGANTMSFSIAWTRIYPFGIRGSPVNEAGLKYYDNLIDELIRNDMEPVVTLFHWDTPLNIVSAYSGFLDEKIVDDFAYYAGTVFKHFGKKVKMWVTFNEPGVYCNQYASLPYNLTYPPGINSTTAPYTCTYQLLKAHATAYRLYKSLADQGSIAKGEIALKHDGSRPVPFNPNNPEDREAVERQADMYIGIFSQPIYGNGNYPERVLKTIPPSILPRFTKDDRKLIKGSADFYAIDAYATQVAKAPPGGIDACARNISDPNWPICRDISKSSMQYSTHSGWALGAAADPLSPWLSAVPNLLRYQLRWLTDNFPSKGGIYLSEFGFAEPYEYDRTELYQITWDERRSNYILDYLNEALLAIHEDGIPLKGAFVWSMADNFEWNLGLQQRFGLQYVNYSDPNLTRTYKLSFFQVRDFFKQHLQK
ncbi:glycoside hydrolase family 1 protein [Sphaerobolus stellatus SS14]|nr:glycoside hydrolase family 1 protein [Sphaerobolus stellatus SS14]